MDKYGPLPPFKDDNRGPVLLAIEILTLFTALCLLCLRIWTRTKIAGNLGWDDLFVVIGMVCSTATIAPFAKARQAGMGRHVYFLSLEQVVKISLWEYVALYLVTVSTLFIRLSVATFLMRLFGVNKYWRRGLVLVIMFIVTTNLVTLVSALLQCQPIQKAWDPTIHGKCWSPAGRDAFATYQGAVGMSSDWGLALLPIACLWKSQLRPVKKIVICSLMGMGIFTGVCPLVRLLLTQNFASPDVSWFLLDQSIWAVLEMNFGLIASCIPTLKPLLQHINAAIKTRRRRKSESFATNNDNVRPQPLGIRRTITISNTSHEAYHLVGGVTEAPTAVKPLPRLYIQAPPSSPV